MLRNSGAAVRYEMEQLKAEGNAINKEIGQLKKVKFCALFILTEVGTYSSSLCCADQSLRPLQRSNPSKALLRLTLVLMHLQI